MKKSIKFDKRLLWLKPFVNSVRDLVPTEKIIEIKGYKVSLKKEELQYASITTRGKRYRINLRLTSNYYIHKIQEPVYLSSILESFAHELAHLKEWDHTIDHFTLTAKILLRFSFVLKHYSLTNLCKRIDKLDIKI